MRNMVVEYCILVWDCEWVKGVQYSKCCIKGVIHS